MPVLRQKSSFGPGKYRGIDFTRERLQKYVDGTNKAIAAGVPIPLLSKKHARPGADDKETEKEAEVQGAGWITKLELNADGAIEWEAKDVPAAVVEARESGVLQYTSPEFRDFYTNEKEGVYEGPIVRHITFTPLPGNPHQGPIEVVALTEQGVFQFSEFDKDQPATVQFNEYSIKDYGKRLDGKHGITGEIQGLTKDHVLSHIKNVKDGTSHDVFHKGKRIGGFSKKGVDPKLQEHLGSQFTEYQHAEKNRFDIQNPNEKSGGQGYSPSHDTNPHHKTLTKQGYKYSHSTPIGRQDGSYYLSHSYAHPDHKDQYASVDLKDGTSSWSVSKGGSGTHYTGKHDADLNKFLTGRLKRLSKKAAASKAFAEVDEDEDELFPGVTKETIKQFAEVVPEDEAEVDAPQDGGSVIDDPAVAPQEVIPPVNPDMPPPMVDMAQLQAVIAGMNQAANVVLPSDWNPYLDCVMAMKVLLTALNTSIKAKQEQEMKEAQELEAQANTAASVQTAPMPYSEQFMEEADKEVLQFAHKEPANEDEARELHLIDQSNVTDRGKGRNPEEASETNLHNKRTAIQNNLAKKHKKGSYEPEKAKKLWGYYAKDLSNHYKAHYDYGGANPATREHLAGLLEEHYRPGQDSQHSERLDKEILQKHLSRIRTAPKAPGSQFTEAQLSELPPAMRVIVENAEKERIKLETEKLQFAEQQRTEKVALARTVAVTKINSMNLPPALKKMFTAQYESVQFSEDGVEPKTLSFSEAAELFVSTLPKNLMFPTKDATIAPAPNGQQFFEKGSAITPEAAKALVDANPLINGQQGRFSMAMPPQAAYVPMQDLVAQANAANPVRPINGSH